MTTHLIEYGPKDPTRMGAATEKPYQGGGGEDGA
jgi:hypothetical protein